MVFCVDGALTRTKKDDNIAPICSCPCFTTASHAHTATPSQQQTLVSIPPVNSFTNRSASDSSVSLFVSRYIGHRLFCNTHTHTTNYNNIYRFSALNANITLHASGHYKT